MVLSPKSHDGGRGVREEGERRERQGRWRGRKRKRREEGEGREQEGRTPRAECIQYSHSSLLPRSLSQRLSAVYLSLPPYMPVSMSASPSNKAARSSAHVLGGSRSSSCHVSRAACCPHPATSTRIEYQMSNAS